MINNKNDISLWLNRQLVGRYPCQGTFGLRLWWLQRTCVILAMSCGIALRQSYLCMIPSFRSSQLPVFARADISGSICILSNQMFGSFVILEFTFVM